VAFTICYIAVMNTVTLEIPEEYARSFGETVEEVRQNAKLELAIEMYREGKWSTRRAAEFAGLNRWQFMDILVVRKVEFPYTRKMLEQDLAYAMGHR
jgi:predicted HTH domain antitoxin